ncbi:HIRAN domain-containing protein [Sphingobium sp. MI1205]|uniref:HIRAN domain-containing protein n=1 Tax=Sphingobium sp. MI1205 TaxID=407020 RepID=UPI0007704142|nr:HIRAN domain-containing protein [Sphingobium sp. MI1205]AMK19357.1 hypothetical protein K663_14895 [Sphingobium sp. MI1205]
MGIKTYDAGLVGEARYQKAVRETRYGERVSLVHETDNRHDPLAVVARNASGQVIGYVPRDSWLQRAIAKERKDVAAYVVEVTGGTRDKPSSGIVLRVAIGDQAELMRAELDRMAASKGCLGFLFK